MTNANGMFGSSDACIITCAISGSLANRDQCPAIPYTPEDYGAEARRAREEGASVVHIHARYPDGRPSYRLEEYRAITKAILDEAPELIINYSTGAIGIPRAERIRHVIELQPELGALNMGSMTYAKYSKRRKKFIFDSVFQNTFEDITFFLSNMNKAGVKPECECFDTGHVANTYPLLDLDLLKRPVQYSLVLGVLGGAPPRTETLGHMASLLPEKSTWELIGISHSQWELVAGAVSLGGNIRVGLEDHFHLPNGQMAKSNGDLVEVSARIIELSGRRVAEPSEARSMLSLADPPSRKHAPVS